MDLGGRIFIDASRCTGGGVDLAYVARILSGTGAPGALELLTREDAYYFSHRRAVASVSLGRLEQRRIALLHRSHIGRSARQDRPGRSSL